MTDMQSGWQSAEEAKERARESVKAAFQRGPEGPPERTCPSCGHTAGTWRARCPNCNKRYDRRLPWLTDPMRWALAILAVVGLGAIIYASRPSIEESKREHAAKEAKVQAARVAAERARLIREQTPVHGRSGVKVPKQTAAPDVRLAARREMVTRFQAAILADAQDRVRSGRLKSKSPVTEVRCDPLIRRLDGKNVLRDEDDLTKPLGRYDCVAVTRPVQRDGKTIAYLGHPFVGTISFDKGTWVFCKDNKLPGERGKPLAKVRLAPECIGAENAEHVADGYLLDEEDAP